MAELQAKLTTVQGLGGSLSSVQGFSATLSNNIKMQSKEVEPTDEEQTIISVLRESTESNGEVVE